MGVLGLFDIVEIGALHLASRAQTRNERARLINRHARIPRAMDDEDRCPARIGVARWGYAVQFSRAACQIIGAETAEIGLIIFAHGGEIVNASPRNGAAIFFRVALCRAGGGIAAIGPAHHADARRINRALCRHMRDKIIQIILHAKAKTIVAPGGDKGAAIAARSAIIGLYDDIAKLCNRLCPTVKAHIITHAKRPAMGDDDHRQPARLLAVARHGEDGFDALPIARSIAERADRVERGFPNMRPTLTNQAELTALRVEDIISATLIGGAGADNEFGTIRRAVADNRIARAKAFIEHCLNVAIGGVGPLGAILLFGDGETDRQAAAIVGADILRIIAIHRKDRCAILHIGEVYAVDFGETILVIAHNRIVAGRADPQRVEARIGKARVRFVENGAECFAGVGAIHDAAFAGIAIIADAHTQHAIGV